MRCLLRGHPELVALKRMLSKIDYMSWVVAIWLFILIPSHLNGGNGRRTPGLVRAAIDGVNPDLCSGRCRYLFIARAFFVLFSTLVSNLGDSARMFADAIVLLDVISSDDYSAWLRVMQIFAVVSSSFFASLAPVIAIGMDFWLSEQIIAGDIDYLWRSFWR